MSKPIAVLISDVHYSLKTFELADAAFRMAIDKAAELGVPLIDCGDLTNDKAVLRAEYVNALISTLQYAKSKRVPVFCMVGNHSLTNEKADDHALHFLEPYCFIISHPTEINGDWFIPYQSSAEKLSAILADIPKGSRIFMHQGVVGAWMGDYVQDKTSLPASAFSDFRVISGHYHRIQDIKTGRPRKNAVGLFSYVGNPYSLSFGEANDGPKGFRILNDNGLLDFVPTNLRKHVIIERTTENILQPAPEAAPGDLVWLKVTGPQSELAKLNRKEIGERLFGTTSFKFDKIATEVGRLDQSPDDVRLTDVEILDKLIDQTTESDHHKRALKSRAKELLSP